MMASALPPPAEAQSRPLAVVTGANTGIGFHAAGQLSARGYHVVLACRSQERAEAALRELRQLYGAEISAEIRPLDLSSFASVRAFAASLTGQHRSLSLLLCNAGLNSASAPKAPDAQLTGDGVDMLYQTNFLSHFLLVLLLLPLLRAAHGRVVSVSSVIHRSAEPELFGLVRSVREPYVSFYGLSKLAQISMTQELHRRFGKGVAFHCVNPGGVASDIWRHYPVWQQRLFGGVLLSPEASARTVVQACVSEEGAAPAPPRYWNGYCFASRLSIFEFWSPLPAGERLIASEPSEDALDAALAQKLWTESVAALDAAGVDLAECEVGV